MRKSAATLAAVVGAAVPLVVGVPAALPAIEQERCAVGTADVERFTQMRTSFGLSSDAAYVRDVSCAADVVPDIHLQIPLDEFESAEMVRRSALPVGQIQAAESVAVPDRFSGVWLDQRQGGVVVAAYTDGGADRLAVISAMLPPGTAVKVITGTTTLARIESIADSLSKVVGKFWEDGIRIVGGADDMKTGTYTVFLDKNAPGASEQLIAEALGGWDALAFQRVDPESGGPQSGRQPLTIEQ